MTVPDDPRSSGSPSATDLRGIFPIVYTPFDAQGRVDEEDLARLVAYLIDSGAHGLSAVGGASECHTMSIEERRWLAERTFSAADGRVPLVVGVSATNTAESVNLSRHAAALGARALFLTPPLYGGNPGIEGLLSHYGAIARAVSIPIMVQDAQAAVSPVQVVQLATAFPTISYVKEEAPLDSGHRISTLKRLRPDLHVLSGGSYLLDDLARGAQGAIPGSIGAGDLSTAYNRTIAGDLAGARSAFDHFTPLSFWRRQFPLLGAKEVLRRIGVFKAAHLRQPGSQLLDEQDHRELSAIMERMGPPY